MKHCGGISDFGNNLSLHTNLHVGLTPFGVFCGHLGSHYQVPIISQLAYPLLNWDTIGGRAPFKVVVNIAVGDGVTWNLSKSFQISPNVFMRTPSYSTNFITTHTWNSEQSHVTVDKVSSVYWTLQHHSLASDSWCATLVTIQTEGALCNENKDHYQCIP